MNIYSKLSQLTKLTDNEQILVNYIIHHPDEIIMMNTKELSIKTYGSQTTIYRLCNKLDLSSFSDLKVLIASQKNDFIQEQDTNFNYPFFNHQTHHQIIHNMEDLYQKSITATKNLIDLDTIRLIVQEMYKAKRISIYPSSGNIYVAENFRLNMQEIGVQIEISDNVYDQHWSACIKDQGDLVIVISYLGKTPYILQLVKELKKRKAKIVFISATYEENISPLSDYHLYMCSYEDFQDKIGSFSSRISLQYILDCLYSCYFERNFDKFLDFKVSHYID